MTVCSCSSNKLSVKRNKPKVKCPMCRTSPLVARKWKFAMKLVNNCIKTCQFCNEYQSILSDVDKHQRGCDKNPNKHQTLTLNDDDDENKFLQNFTHNLRDSMASQKLENVKREEVKIEEVKKEETVPSIQQSRPAMTTETEEESDEEEEEESEEEGKEEESKDPPLESVKVTKVEVLNTPGKRSNKNGSGPPVHIDDSIRILPHFHKHDLHKRDVYDKPSYWIWGGYFTELGCINTFNCLFKNIDFEFPHYQCNDCEFQVCLDWVDYYSQSSDDVKFIHRTYNPPYHCHPVKLELGSEKKSWTCSGMGLPNKCLSVDGDEGLIGHKKWKWTTCKVQLCYKCVRRKDIEDSINCVTIHKHQMFKAEFGKYFSPNENIFCDASSQFLGISHEIDQEQKVLRCAPCNFNCCMECFEIISSNIKEEQKNMKESQMMNDNILDLQSDQVVYTSRHPHPLYQVVDANLLCDQVQTGSCKSLKHKSTLSKPAYLKCVKGSWNFQLCALWTSPYVKKVKSVKKGGTWIIF